jgi:hypothetical protein
MTSFSRPVQRVTIAPYKHHRRPIVVSLYADTISMRLKGTRTAYEIPVSHVMDYVLRIEAVRIAREKAAARKARRQARKH